VADAVAGVWEYLNQVHREAFHRCTCLGSTAPDDLIVMQRTGL
jgi:hypothetical protein